MTDMTAQLVAKLREALEFFNDHPSFALRYDRRRTSYKIAAEIEKLLKDAPEQAKFVGNAADGATNPETSYSDLQMEAALCCWEWMLEERSKSPEVDAFQREWEAVGSAGMRQCAAVAGAIALKVHDAMTSMGYEHIGAYDWEFIPAVMERLDWVRLVGWVQHNRPPYTPDADNLFGVIYAADRATRSPGQRLFHQRGAS